jgi:hypothetical protein
MAKIKYGTLVGQASGSIGAMTFSHNRYGTYVRRRAIPVQAGTALQLAIRQQLGDASTFWKSLSLTLRTAWQAWADQNPIADVLGDRQTLTGHAAFIKINSKYRHILSSYLQAPPVAAAPSSFITLAVTADIGAGDVSLVFSETPCIADEAIEVWACTTNSKAINFLKNRLKYCGITAAACVSGVDVQTLIEDRIGALVIGQTLHVCCARYSKITGLWSTFRRASAVVTHT